MLLLSIGLAGGCSEQDSTPRFTRVFVSDNCGTVPLSVEFAAYVTGGEQNDHATGGNMWHDIEWDFGDGETGLGSITYHVYTEPGSYDVRVIARDKNGATAEASALVAVLSDTLMVSTSSMPPSDAFENGGNQLWGLDGDDYHTASVINGHIQIHRKQARCCGNHVSSLPWP